MIVDGLENQTLGDFNHEVAENGCHLRQTELESLCQMAAEGGICELKIGSDRKMTKMKSPKVLWDNILE